MVAPDSAPSDSLPSAFRASDEDRDDVIRMLSDGSVAGRISNETFLRRVDRALRARGVDELAELLSDLPPVPDQGCRGLVGPVHHPAARDRQPAAPAAGGAAAAAAATARPAPWPAGPCSPSAGRRTATFRSATSRSRGTTPSCGAAEEAWVLADLGSTNGTRVNGWRADSGFTVRAGDWVSFGRSAFRIADHG